MGATLTVGGMTCPACEESLGRAIGRVAGVLSVHADHRKGVVEVESDVRRSEADIRRAVEDSGYDLIDIEVRPGA